MAHLIPPPFSPQELKARQIPKLGDFAPQSQPFRAYMPPPINEPSKAVLDHPRRFDQETYNQISGLDARLLEQIDFDCRQQAKRSRTGARYSTHSEAYYAKVLGVRRETISHHVCHLANLGILEITRRRKVRGVWQTNMYKIKSWIWWRLGRLLRGLRKRPDRVTQGSHKAVCKTEKEPEKPENRKSLSALTQKILARWTERGIIKDADH